VQSGLAHRERRQRCRASVTNVGLCKLRVRWTHRPLAGQSEDAGTTDESCPATSQRNLFTRRQQCRFAAYQIKFGRR
jgi:hypothetical protein